MTPGNPGGRRLVIIDMARGSAVFLMIAYHFCYDLNYFRLARFDFYGSPFWLNFRSFIVSLFLLVSGISLVLATRKGLNRAHFSRRLAVLVAAALAITVISYFMFPGRTILMGILHFIAIASLLALPFLPFYKLNLFAGILVILAGIYVKLPLFDNIWLHWIGLVTHKPATEDYVPLFPWFGVVLIGLFIGKMIIRQDRLQAILITPPSCILSKPLVLAGRHSLAIYLLHQPILMGILYAVTHL